LEVPLFIAGMYRDRGLAERVVRALLDSGVPEGEISLAVREEAEEDVRDRAGVHEPGSPSAALAVQSAWERLGWLSGARPPYRNRIAPQIDHAILAAGPLAIAIGGAQVGASAGGVTGAMANFGFPLDLAKDWYQSLLDGQAWIMVRTGVPDAARARGVLERYSPALPAESLRHW
jgi:hypothetical protein